MQNPGTAAGPAGPRESDPSLALLTEAVLRLTQQATRDPPITAPTSRLTKLGPDDDVEAYLETFEQVATREGWPEAQWACIVAPFLTGPAQQASQDINPGDAGLYPALKAAVLAYYGHSLAAKALNFHEWTFDVRGLVRTQVAHQCRLARRWLVDGAGPSPVDRVVVDNVVRQLPPDARRVLAHHHPETVDDLVRQLENWQVAQRLAAGPRPNPRATRRETPTPPSRTRPSTPPRERGEPEIRRCYHCGQRGHLVRDCPDRQDVPMPSACTAPRDRPTCMLATCWTQGDKDSPTVPIKVMHQDTHALLDTGSAVTLVRADLAGGRPGTPMQVSCVHGDTRTYETCHVVVRTPQGVFVARAGIVPTLPVPFLIGRDCPIFTRFWSSMRGNRGGRELHRPAGRSGRPAQRGARRPPTRESGSESGPAPTTAADHGPALGATRRPTATRTETDDTPGSGGEGPSAPGSPPRSTGDQVRPVPGDGAGPSSDTVTASERGNTPEEPESSPLTELSDFAQAGGENSARPGQFATAQHRDDALRHAWGHVVAHDGQVRDSVSHLTHPHFCTQRGLLYRVDVRGGEVIQQLVVPRPYVSKVLFMAHTHLLGAHLGMDKTRERVVARFYWPGVRRDVARYCQECPDCQRVAPRAVERSPLIPMPIIETPFERIALDIVGPLPRTSRGHRYLLVILDYATRYPEALPLRAATSKAVARELVLLFSRVGLPKEILTDQGSCFMSRVVKELLKLLQVSQLRTSVYHPQTDGLVERFNQTIKRMLKKSIEADGKNWDQLLPHVLFAIREVPQASTGFSPFELLYGRRPRGILDLAKEAWESHPSPHRTTIEHVELVRDRMAKVWHPWHRHPGRRRPSRRRGACFSTLSCPLVSTGPPLRSSG
uniref:Gypsy retrotransposon integrase-like protein 1 n=1 Tax=Gadus morhua TaxID=8049 RepID=A0A8C5BU63_GADMO